MCQQMAEFGMEMAGYVMHRARTAHAAQLDPPEHPAPKPRAPQRATQDHNALALSRISRVVHQSIALEARIANPEPARPRQPARPLADPRRLPLKRVFEIALAKHPDRASLKRESNENLEAALAADPDQAVYLDLILDAICEHLGIDIDFDALPDDLIAAIIGPDPSRHAPPPNASPPNALTSLQPAECTDLQHSPPEDAFRHTHPPPPCVTPPEPTRREMPP